MILRQRAPRAQRETSFPASRRAVAPPHGVSASGFPGSSGSPVRVALRGGAGGDLQCSSSRSTQTTSQAPAPVSLRLSELFQRQLSGEVTLTR